MEEHGLLSKPKHNMGLRKVLCSNEIASYFSLGAQVVSTMVYNPYKAWILKAWARRSCKINGPNTE